MMQSSIPATVLWDMDGTLIDQTTPILRCYRDVITALGYPEPSAAEIRRSMGGTMASTMAHFVAAEDQDAACAAFRLRFPEIMFDGLVVLPGAHELIALFAAHNIPQAILTNKHGETARAVSSHCGFSRNIQHCVGNTDTPWAKPDAQLTRYVLQEIGAAAAGTVLIGDSPTDAATALNAGLLFYGVATGAHSVEELTTAGAELAYPSLAELATGLEFS